MPIHFEGYNYRGSLRPIFLSLNYRYNRIMSEYNINNISFIYQTNPGSI